MRIYQICRGFPPFTGGTEIKDNSLIENLGD